MSLQLILAFSSFAGLCKLDAQIAEKAPQTRQSNWQQVADHDISVRLDAKQKMLYCEETITYTNNSPNELKVIRMHIWPNAFSVKNKAYGQESRISGSDFLAAKKEELGSLDSLDFKIDGIPASFVYINDEPDQIEILLPSPLQSGSSIKIHTPFRVKIPFLFSRIGYSGSLFSITQWYPKPAVYDVNGWNTFSYQDQGEYYSEFGTYKVSITLPKNYVVGATGVLQNEDEVNWLTEKAEGTAKAKETEELKTLVYVQDNVPDFAWFADPGFSVGEADVTLPNGHKVHTYALLTEDATGTKSSVLESIQTALTYYSKRVGFYPYDYCTAVIGKLTSAGGMEYPMITICGDANEGTIIHEVGHNWFQGMLGSQERRYPWMDESINTFYQNQAEGKGEKEWKTGSRINATGEYSTFRLSHDLGVFQSGTLHSEMYQNTNYGTIVYTVNPLRFNYLQEYLGKVIMDSCMKKYFELWHYKHPLPGDIQQVFENVSGQKLGWFFVDLLGGTTPDMAIKSVKKNGDKLFVKIANNGDYTLPIKLQWKEGDKLLKMWISGSDTTVEIPMATEVNLNPTGNLPESNMANNDARTNGVLKTTGKLKFGLPDLYHRGWNKTWILPNFFTGNKYDGYTPGLLISNITFPRRRWEWWAAPSYSVKQQTVVGNAGIQRNIWFQNGPFAIMEIVANGKTYHFSPDTGNKLNQFYHINTGFSLYQKRKKPWVQHIWNANYSYNRLAIGFSTYVDFRTYSSRDFQNDIVQIKWVRESYKKSLPFTMQAIAEIGRNFQKDPLLLFVPESNFKFAKMLVQGTAFLPYHFFKSKLSGLHVNGFAHFYLSRQFEGSTNGQYNPVISGANGGNDYTYRDVLMGRSESFGSGNRWGRQLLVNTPGIRMLPNIVAPNYAVGLNLTSALAPKVPIKLFADAVIGGVSLSSSTYWAGGICLQNLIGNKVTYELNLPLVYSSNFDGAMAGLKWYQTWNFKLNLSIYNLFHVARQVYR